MTRVARFAVLLLLLWVVVSELGRYRAERTLGEATALVRRAQAGSLRPSAAELRAVESAAEVAARRLPGDPRPYIVAGSAHLLARDPAGALAWYGRALAAGERAEVDLNVGRAAMMRRDLMEAQRAFLRAGWLSPQLLLELPEVARAPLQRELSRLTVELEVGVPGAVPPPPVIDLPGGGRAFDDR